MSEPDGPEQRTADAEECSEREYDELDRMERLADEQLDESLLDLAEARMTSFWIDKVQR